jgi:5-methylthioadenosine/S-adenosylhomocysteine deaminase
MKPMQFDTVIHGGTIIAMNPAADIIGQGVICVQDGRIVSVDSLATMGNLPKGRQVVDAAGCMVMPGLVNTHTHMPMSLFRGLADDLPLDEWLHEHMFPAEAVWINPENVRLGTLLACAEMLLSGTTSFCGGYFHEDEVATVVQETGIRGVLGQGVIDFPAPGVPDPSRNIKAAEAYADKWQNRSALIQPSLFCHSPYTCSAGTIQAAKAAARSRNILFQIHIGETSAEQGMIQEAGDISPIQYLDHLGVLDEQTLLVHAVWVDDKDIAIIADKNACISHNPESNMKLASGVAPVMKFLDAGIRVGLGTDGCASNNDLDLFQEMDTTAKLHKVHSLDPTAMDAATVMRMATIMGAKTIGLGNVIGSLEPGKQADLIVIDTQKPHLVPMYHPISQAVYAVRGSDVRDVMVSGRLLVREGALTGMNLPDILTRVNALSEMIKRQGKTKLQ